MNGIRIFGVTSVLSGPSFTWHLATLRADVIKVEIPMVIWREPHRRSKMMPASILHPEIVTNDQ